MRRERLVVLGLGWLLGAAAPHMPAAGTPNALTPEEAAAGWRLLFDGKTMSGWQDPARKSPPGDGWAIEEGCLKAVRAPRIREDLLTTESFGDFELAFEWRISPGGNSGVKYRIQDLVLLEQAEGRAARRFEERVDEEFRRRVNLRSRLDPSARYEEYAIGFEYQVIDDRAHPDAAHGADRAAGALYSLVPVTQRAARPAGEFNQGRIVLRGDRVEHWLNGVKVVEADLRAPSIAQMLARRWTAASPVYDLLTRQPKKRTPIGLQHHQDEAWFRSVKIRTR